MSEENKNALITAARRVVISGLVLLFIWLLLVGLRAAIPVTIAERLAEQMDWAEPLSQSQKVQQVNEAIHESDWSVSMWDARPVSETVGSRLGLTFQLLGFGGLLALVAAALLLFLGFIISRLTQRPGWLNRTTSVLRLLLVSGGSGMPMFLAGGVLVVYLTAGPGGSLPAGPAADLFRMIALTAWLPAWLLVQAGQGELAALPEEMKKSYGLVARHLAVRLVIRLLRLTGAVLAVTVITGGIGTLVFAGAVRRDFPLLFGVVRTMVLIVVLARLAADLIEIAYNRFGNPRLTIEEDTRAEPTAIPKVWMYVSLALVLVIIALAWLGPLFAPYGFNEISISDRLSPPSAAHILGADNLGRDIFTRLLFGLRNTLNMALVAIGLLALVAAGWVALAAFLRGKAGRLGGTSEDLAMLPADVLCAVPWLALLLLLAGSLVVEPGFFVTALIIGVALLPRAVRMIMESYRSAPSGSRLPGSWLRAVPVVLLFSVAGGMIYASTLSYQGFGLPPPFPELGGMLSGTGRTYLLQAPWIAQSPMITVVIVLLIWVMAGEALLERLGFRSKAVWAKSME